MIRLGSDADVHGALIRGLRRRRPDLDLVRSQDVLPEGASDAEVLLWAARDGRTLITNDRGSALGLACDWRAAGRAAPGIIATTTRQSIGATIDDILLIADCMSEDELRDRLVVFLPLR